MNIKKFTYPVILFSLLLLMASCMGNKTSIMITKDFEISDFETLNLEVIGEVIFEQSASPYLSAEGNQNLVDELDVSQKNNRLSIKSKKDRSLFSDKGKLTLKIGSPSLNEIQQKGVGSLLIKGSFDAKSLSVIHTGVGSFTVDNCKLDQFNLESQAVGSSRVKGIAKNVVLKSDGVGNIDCSDLKAEKAKIVSKGVGNLSVYADQELDITVKGVGNVTYGGNPEVLKTDISGIGKVKEL